MRLSRLSFRIALAITGLALVAGCVATPPADLPTAGQSESPTAEAVAPVATTLVVSATSITVLDETSATIADIPFTTDPAVAATQLADALGVSSSISTRPEGNCERGGTIYDFGGFTLDATGTVTVQPAVFSMIVTAPATSAGVQILGPGGTQVGQSFADIVAEIPATAGHEYELLVLQNIGTADSPEGVGGDLSVAGVWTDKLSTIMSPVYLAADC